MDLKEEFNHALQLISKQKFEPATVSLSHPHGHPLFAQCLPLQQYSFAPFFETVIRYLGGLLSAYALSSEPMLLEQADALALKLLPVFNGTESGLPAYSVHTQTYVPRHLSSHADNQLGSGSRRGRTGFGWMGPIVLFAEATSCQLEYKYLAKLTGRKEYYERVGSSLT